MPDEYFEIIEEKFFQKKIDSYRKKYKRIDEVHETLTWALGKNPYYGTIIEATGEQEVRVFHTTGFGDTPGFWVLYEVNKKKGQVNLLSIHPIREAKPE